jgi:hypothetical protein
MTPRRVEDFDALEPAWLELPPDDELLVEDEQAARVRLAIATSPTAHADVRPQQRGDNSKTSSSG